ncbi:MAG: transcriptional repressor [Eubacterium sp.]|nr:transcriptional repressor [Eubacterium sp.]MDD7209933.1 transcriptional repressor [Lachnospiraceae bacterium]MDY5498287.1 transcriptional repressor [Anaerobutyricum sp.]
MTKYEKEIFSMINSSCGHLTAEEIFQKLKRKYPNVVLATVYNNLRKLLEEELIKKVSIEGMPDRYDRVNKHDHLVCKCCGRLSDITLKDLTASLSDQLDDDFLYYDLKVYYICPECKKQNKGE